MNSRILNALRSGLLGRPRRKSWALNRLDWKLARHVKRRNGVFVEAGGNDGLRQSNTMYFETYRGWTGLLIEAVPKLAERCRRNRPNCRVENCALVSAEFTEPTIDIHYRDLMSVIKGSMADPAEEARHLALGEGFMKPDDVPQLLTVPAKTLSRVLDEQGIGPVDLLSLDVEGYEVQVLNGMDWRRHRPAFLLLEVRDQPGIEAVIAPWYRRAAVLNETEDYADILYARKD